MMLPLRANDVVPAAQMKNPKAELSDFWQGQKGSNPRHAVLETAALPAELYPCIQFFAVSKSAYIL